MSKWLYQFILHNGSEHFLELVLQILVFLSYEVRTQNFVEQQATEHSREESADIVNFHDS